MSQCAIPCAGHPWQVLLPRSWLIPLTEGDASSLLRETVINGHPGCFRGDHEVHFSGLRGVGVKGAEPEPQYLWCGVVALVDRRAAAPREESVDAGA